MFDTESLDSCRRQYDAVQILFVELGDACWDVTAKGDDLKLPNPFQLRGPARTTRADACASREIIQVHRSACEKHIVHRSSLWRGGDVQSLGRCSL
jgi:hypothetical protein